MVHWKSRALSRIIPILLCLSVVAACVPVVANASQINPYLLIVPVEWRTSTLNLTVGIPTVTPWVHDVVRKAMAEWNNAQDSFLAQFYPNDTGNDKYYFTPWTNVTHQPDVQLVLDANINNLYGLPSILADTTPNPNHTYTIFMSSRLTSQPDSARAEESLYRVMLHELGHVLGLGEEYGENDVMNAVLSYWSNNSSQTLISTTDFYAVRMLALAAVQVVEPCFVLLTNLIPYLTVNVDLFPSHIIPVPEFNSAMVIVAFSLLSSVFLFAYNRKKPR